LTAVGEQFGDGKFGGGVIEAVLGAGEQRTPRVAVSKGDDEDASPR
jgi:hypothetical protein